MLFNSLAYAVFLPLVTLVYFVLPHRFRWAALLVFSYYFYMSWDPELVVLILFTTAVSWGCGLLVERWRARPALKKAALYTGVGLCLAVLFFFKYFNFVSASVTAVCRVVGLPLTAPVLELILPVGISFYTFQTLSYVIDVYRGDLAAEKHFGIYALYVSFFPQLVAGPIERAGRLLPQFRQQHSFCLGEVSAGLRKIGVGLVKKVVIADYLAVFVNTVYNDLYDKTGLTLIGATVLFAVQIYCDFSGYSDIAVGSARILGFRLMENFRSPYFSRSLGEFWQRWHISLSQWFEDYLYTPVAWSCRSPAAGSYLGLVVVFAASGLWHGAAWTFVLWGLVHAVYRVTGAALKRPRRKLYKKWKLPTGSPLFTAGQTLVTFVLVCISYIFFRANSIADLGYVLTHLHLGLNPLRLPAYMAAAGMGTPQLLIAAGMILLLAAYDWLAYYKGDPLELVCRLPAWLRYVLYWGCGVMILLALMHRPLGTAADFIYFQF